MSGPNCRLEHYKIERNELVRQEDEMVETIKDRIGEYACITSHSWRDNDYFGVVTEDAQICVYKILEGIVHYKRYD